MRAYTTQLKGLGSKILEHKSEGLGLEPHYFDGQLSGDDYLTINHYPSCPNPNLTLGLPKHTDPNLITILLQDDALGLQLFKDGQWFDVDPLPNSFIIMVSNQLEIVSNGKLKSAIHRAVTNARKARTSIVYFINPTRECIVQTANKPTEDNPPLFTFLGHFNTKISSNFTLARSQTILRWFSRRLRLSDYKL
ncbi:hypothetical protein vseg_001718 [Gypsophila vaccaria]